MPYQTVMLACVVESDTHKGAVEKLQRLLGEIAEYAESTGNTELSSLMDECWLPNDCPNSEWRVKFTQDVDAADLIRAAMFRAYRQAGKSVMPMTEIMRQYGDVHMYDPGLSLWRESITEAAETCAKHVCESPLHVQHPQSA